MSLSSFLAHNALPVENIKYVASKRFVDEMEDPIAWELTGITSTEDEVLRKSCTKRIPVPGKKGQFTQDTDYNKYLGLMAAKCTIYPDLNDAELQNSYGVMGADELIKAMLTPGEYSEYLSKIQEINGFDTSFEEQVDEAKNS